MWTSTASRSAGLTVTDVLVIEDEDLAASIRAALRANPELAERIIELMVQGCTTIEEFEKAIEQIRVLRPSGPILMASQRAAQCFTNMLDIFGELLTISTGSVDEPGDN